MAAHFSISPRSEGTLRWASATELVFEHPPFRPSTVYSVRLAGGYRDTAGHTNQLAHGWRFKTEAPPALTGSSPGSREQNVDPATYIALEFNRAMDVRSLQGAVSISPYLPVTVRTDPADARRAIVAPLELLEPGASYSVTVTHDARDVDGNRLQAGVSVDFATGAQRPLSHWVTFVAEDSGRPAGVWVVDGTRVPRQLAAVTADSFEWSLDGSHLLAHSPGGSWSDIAVGGSRDVLPFEAGWAAFLAPDLGYAYVSKGTLSILPPSGAALTVDTGVGNVAVSPDGRSLAYVARRGTEIRGYAVELRARYSIAREAAAVDGLAWSPDATRLAYRLAGSGPLDARIRVKELFGSGAVTTVGIGEVGVPRWQADSRHVILSAMVTVDQALHARPFRLAAGDAAGRPLTADQAIPTPAGIDVEDPVPSPDGHQVAFLEQSAGRDQVYVMNVDGSGFGALTAYDETAFPYSCRAPAWTRT